MPHRTRPMTALLLFTALNAALCATITPVYDFVCFLPYWERRLFVPELTLMIYWMLVCGMFNYWEKRSRSTQRERRRQEREAAIANSSK